MTTTQRPARVLVVDDSALIRQLLTELIDRAPDMEVVGAARDPYDAREQIKALNPDVLTLDVEMPKMDGLVFLRNLMRLRPMPVVMVSSLTREGADETLEALALGAVDFLPKPQVDIAEGLEAYAEDLLDKLRAAARARPRALPDVRPTAMRRRVRTTERLLAVGASTGGTEAIRVFLQGLPRNCPGVVVTQHIPPGFSAAFAERMNRQTGLVVSEAQDGQRVLPGHVCIAPGDRHLEIERDGARYVCRLSDAPPVNRHRPSVDVLFRSVAVAAGPRAVGVLMTGMGVDGAEGLGAMLAAGADTLAQDEATSVVWGMPGEAVHRGAAAEVLPLERLAEAALARASAEEGRGGAHHERTA
ncbi:protein-glutamate methylesterase/protein-glutamine glutaminase [Spiribacter halobius]|uniref:Protein-glutamate methylesterase/protein-glutamine glutaminase n=1 Tax=Sediminicurvatus halobius TaxID=2182432 RepID=A0A2U2N500_9GAMM|nr:chemotaxis response regulator protein-glutamate methylesterase [Spiribacter halobius]PWG64128.1 chemotaxis response regulator protein-glutamate methylesterase [Spiribacter halobius]UEX78749.1 chemotaxis response regulator protein-glutamate methylesterase [Spiribacter halobius]